MADQPGNAAPNIPKAPGALTLFASGVVLIPLGTEVTVPLTHNNETLYFKFEFRDDKTKGAFATESQIESEQTVKFLFYNYTNALGTFLIAPLQFGTIGGEPLWLLWKIIGSPGAPTRQIDYSFFFEGKKNG